MTFYLLRWPGQSLTAASKLVAVLAFGVLGPLSVQVDGQVVELAGARQRTLLARLLVAGGRVVPVGTIIDDLWGDALPA